MAQQARWCRTTKQLSYYSMPFSRYSPCLKRGPDRISTASQYKVATDRLIQFVSPVAEPTMRRLVPYYPTTRTIKWRGGGRLHTNERQLNKSPRMSPATPTLLLLSCEAVRKVAILKLLYRTSSLAYTIYIL
jgi:hypothetical protein